MHVNTKWYIKWIMWTQSGSWRASLEHKLVHKFDHANTKWFKSCEYRNGIKSWSCKHESISTVRLRMYIYMDLPGLGATKPIFAAPLFSEFLIIINPMFFCWTFSSYLYIFVRCNRNIAASEKSLIELVGTRWTQEEGLEFWNPDGSDMALSANIEYWLAPLLRTLLNFNPSMDK